MENINKLKPFPKFCCSIGYIPTSYKVALTYEEQLMWLCNFIENEIIPVVNQNGEAVEELQKLYVELKSYVDNYFENLDVQQEINNKLDEMAESGELATIIAQYLQLACVFGFDTISDMADAEYLIEGSICKTVGRNTYDDGYGDFFRVRPVLTTDTIDGYNIVALTNLPTLIAERITNQYLIDAIATVNDRIDNLDDKKWIFVGDSYSEPPEGVTSWNEQLKTRMGLSNSEVIFAHHGGAGFANPSYPFYDIIDGLTSDNDVTDILIAGGYNDLTFSDTNIVNGINSVATLITTKFPNAKVHLAVIGGTLGQYHGHMHLLVESYEKGALNNNWHFINNVFYVLYNRLYFLTDGVHPNQDGQTEIAKALYQGLIGEFDYIKYREISIDTSQSDYFPTVTFPLHLISKNDISILSNYSGTIILTANQTFSLPYNGSFKLGKIDQVGIIGTDLSQNCRLTLPQIVVQNWSGDFTGYFNVPCTLTVDQDGYVYIKMSQLINHNATGFMNFDGVHQIQIPNFSVVYPTIML